MWLTIFFCVGKGAIDIVYTVVVVDVVIVLSIQLF